MMLHIISLISPPPDWPHGEGPRCLRPAPGTGEAEVSSGPFVLYFLSVLSVVMAHNKGLMFYLVLRLAFAGENIYSHLNSHLSVMANSCSAVDLLGSSLHVWPDFHGNRSPLADPTLKGMVRCLKSRLDTTDFMTEKYYLYVPHWPAEVK